MSLSVGIFLPQQGSFAAESCQPGQGGGIRVRADVMKVTQVLQAAGDKAADPRCSDYPRPCDRTALASDHPHRKRYDAFILKASRATGVPAALIKAQVAAETSLGDPQKENLGEKDRFRKAAELVRTGASSEAALKKANLTVQDKYKWGKGLGQFGADYAPDFGMAWYQSRAEIRELNPQNPKLQRPGTQEFEAERKKLRYFLPGEEIQTKAGATVKLKSVFDPEAAILGKALMLKKNIDFHYTVESNGRTIDALAKMPEVERLRLAVAAYNRGTGRVSQSLKSYFLTHGTLPQKYIEVAHEPVHPEISKVAKAVLNGHPANRCHVLKIVGLCGDLSGFLRTFDSDFPVAARYFK